jgi:hypothetical protein
MEIAVSRERASDPESELIKLVERLVDDVLVRRRHRPQPQLRAMSKRQCATASNLGISSIEAAIRDGSLAAHKVGTRTIIRSEDHDLWLANLPRIKPKRSHDDGAAHANV